MSINARFAFVLRYVRDVDEARRFYTEVLGLEVERSAPTFVQFGTFALASDERIGEAEDTELHWEVGDAEAAFAELSGGARDVAPIREMPFGKVLAANDPSGHSCLPHRVTSSSLPLSAPVSRRAETSAAAPIDTPPGGGLTPAGAGCTVLVAH